MNTNINTLEIPFPKNLEALAALDATREIPFLKAHCNRRHIHTPGPKPTPSQIIPIIQQSLAHLQAHPPLSFDPHTGEYCEWKLIHDDLQEFLTNLQTLALATSQVPEGCRNRREISPMPNAQCSMLDDQSFSGPPPNQKSSIVRHQSSIAVPPVPPFPTPRHFHNSHTQPPKTPAISNISNPPHKTLRHFHDSTPKISPNLQTTIASSCPSINSDEQLTSPPSEISESPVPNQKSSFVIRQSVPHPNKGV